MTRQREGLIGLKKIFFFITLIFLGTLTLLSFALWQTARNQELKSHRQLVDSVLKVARDSIAARDQIAIERVLQAFHTEGRNFRLTLPQNFELIWPREHFNPVWDRKPDYKTTISAGDGQILTVEYWVPHDRHEDTWPFVALALSFLLAAASIAALWFHLRRWRSDVTRIQNYLLDPKAALEMDFFHFDFFHGLASQIAEKESEREKRFESEKRSEKLRELAGQAAQVAHDIRSPLAALDAILGTVTGLPEDSRIVVRNAANRIHDIANGLLQKNREAQSGASPARLQLLSTLIDDLVTEKRMQYRSRPHVSIEACMDAASYGIFALVQPVEFSRVLSNLINNSVEAFGDGPGSVQVRLSALGGRARVSVKDDGKGIPPEILSRLGRRGETHGKSSGSGLGIHHAAQSAEAWGGTLAITSEIGAGTAAVVDMPRAPAPDWFVSELNPLQGHTVVILDDDTSIHHIWKVRFDADQVREHGGAIANLSTPGELRSWVAGNDKDAREALYLLDFELAGFVETGLSLAAELGIGERTVLVTSRYEEPEILDNCRKLKARIIPKGLAGLVPINFVPAAPATNPSRERWDAILIDDDELTRATWRLSAEKAGKKLQALATAAEFLRGSDRIDRETPVYIDAELGDGVRGQDESLKIFDQGFRKIYITTGHEPAKFNGLTHLRGVVGKAPLWT